MSFFPHLIAGLILRAREFYPQIQEKYFRNIQWERAIYFLVVGFFQDVRSRQFEHGFKMAGNSQFSKLQCHG